MLTERINKFKEALTPYKNDLFTATAIVLMAVIGFGLGRLSAIYERKTPITVEYLNNIATTTSIAAPQNSNKKMGTDANNINMVASKNGGKYYPVNCPAASRIKEENKIKFNSAKEAESAGYSASAMCE